MWHMPNVRETFLLIVDRLLLLLQATSTTVLVSGICYQSHSSKRCTASGGSLRTSLVAPSRTL